MPMYTNMYLSCLYSKWSEFEFISCVAKKFGVNRRWVQEWCQQMDKLQKLKKSFICRFGWKDFPSYYKYIHSRAIFVLEKGGVLLLGTVLLLGHIRYMYSSIEPAPPVHNCREIGPLFMEILHFKEWGTQKCHKRSLVIDILFILLYMTE